jgi:hypothetical protein
MILTSDDVWKFSQAWISLAFLLYIVALGIVHGVHYPNLRRMNALMAELSVGGGAPAGGGATGGRPPQLAELEDRGKRVAAVGGLLHLDLAIILILMIWKPGA